MFRILLLAFAIAICVCCITRSDNHISQELTQPLRAATPAAPTARSSPLAGAYELISETLKITEPEQRTDSRTADEWTGLWLFQNGRFSQTLEKKRRMGWFSGLPHDPHELGFDSSAGSYKVIGDTIELRLDMSFYPEETGRTVKLNYQFNGDTLMLTEQLHSTKESLSRGQRITVLRRVQ